MGRADLSKSGCICDYDSSWVAIRRHCSRRRGCWLGNSLHAPLQAGFQLPVFPTPLGEPQLQMFPYQACALL